MTNTSNPSDAPTLVLEAGRADAHYWRDLWRYRELLGFLAWRDVKVRYKQAVLGVAWVVVQPMVQTVLLTFVFSKLAKMPGGDVPYPLLVLAGLLPWQLFSGAFSGAGTSLVNNANLISKVYFPRLIVPLSAVMVALIDMAVLLLLIGGYAAFGLTSDHAAFAAAAPTWRLLLLPLFILGTMLVALGAGLWITALTVKYRDFRFIAPFILQIGVFVTPVGYRTDFLPNWRDILAFNPLTSMVEGFRWCMFGGHSEFYVRGLAISLAMTAALLGSGLWFFRQTERQFADVI
jgi:lipopolysaccharide transport system permease protein